MARLSNDGGLCYIRAGAAHRSLLPHAVRIFLDNKGLRGVDLADSRLTWGDRDGVRVRACTLQLVRGNYRGAESRRL